MKEGGEERKGKEGEGNSNQVKTMNRKERKRRTK